MVPDVVVLFIVHKEVHRDDPLGKQAAKQGCVGVAGVFDMVITEEFLSVPDLCGGLDPEGCGVLFDEAGPEGFQFPAGNKLLPLPHVKDMEDILIFIAIKHQPLGVSLLGRDGTVKLEAGKAVVILAPVAKGIKHLLLGHGKLPIRGF